MNTADVLNIRLSHSSSLIVSIYSKLRVKYRRNQRRKRFSVFFFSLNVVDEEYSK